MTIVIHMLLLSLLLFIGHAYAGAQSNGNSMVFYKENGYDITVKHYSLDSSVWGLHSELHFYRDVENYSPLHLFVDDTLMVAGQPLKCLQNNGTSWSVYTKKKISSTYPLGNYILFPNDRTEMAMVSGSVHKFNDRVYAIDSHKFIRVYNTSDCGEITDDAIRMKNLFGSLLDFTIVDANHIIVQSLKKPDYYTTSVQTEVFEFSGGEWVLSQAIDQMRPCTIFEFGDVLPIEQVTGIPYGLKLGGDFLVTHFKDSGYIEVYKKNGAEWNTTAVKIEVNGVGALDGFGSSFDINDTGDKILVGAPQFNSGDGIVYVFYRNGASWDYYSTSSVNPPGSGDYFGSNVVLTSDGKGFSSNLNITLITEVNI